MYNIRRKLLIFAMLLFVASGIITKFSVLHNDKAVIANSNTDTANTNYSTVFDGDNTNRFVAHRGYSNYAPENSIPAFELAGKIGFWGIETDICETSDGQFVCMHDEDLDRTTDGTGNINEYTLEEINQFKIDTGNYVNSSENLNIPTFDEFLAICSKYDCVPVIEIKSVSNYDTFLSTVIASGLETHCIITGDIEALKEIRARNTIIPLMTIGYSPAPYTDNLAYIAELSENRGILYNYPQVDKEAIDIIHSQNILCGVWSVDNSETAKQYIDFGVDFVVTNEIPARINKMMINENE